MTISRVSVLLAINVFFSGAGFAAMTPYRAIVGVEVLGMSNGAFGIVMALNALGGAGIAVFLGWLSDRVRDRRLLVLICAVAGLLGFAMVLGWRSPIGFATAFCLLVPFGNALFSQSFSYSRAYFDRAYADRAEFMTSVLRTFFTIAWIVVPPLAGWLAARTGAYSVFYLSALAHLGCTVAIAALMRNPEARVGLPVPAAGETSQPQARPRIQLGHRAGILGVALSMAALHLNISLLPLVIVRDLGGTLGQVGLVSAVAAVIEVPVIIGWGILAGRVRKESILAFACLVFAAYFALMVVAGGVWHVLVLQLPAAIAVSALLSINISYLQEAIPGRLGLSTSLVDVTTVAAALMAAAVFAVNPWDSYAPLMAVAALLCVVGSAALLLARRLARPLDV